MRLCEAFAALLEGRFDAFIQNLTDAPPDLPGARYAPGPMSLRAYLRSQPFGLPEWRQALLLQRRLITISRRLPDRRWTTLRESLTLDFQLNTPVGNVDMISVNLDDALHQQDLTALAAAAKDYAFVAPHELDDNVIVNEEAILNATGAVVFGQSSLTESATLTLEDFVERLMSSERVTGPARQLRVASHAHWIGELSVGANLVARRSSIAYEDVARNERLPSQPLHIPDACVEPRSAANGVPVIVLTGCEIGFARKYLEKLRRLINPRLTLYGPRYWFAAVRTDAGEALEFMGQPFMVSDKGPLTRAALIAKLQGLGARDAWGTPIGNDEWAGWVPVEPWPTDDEFYIDRRIDVRLPGFSVSTGNVSPQTMSLNCVALWKSHIGPGGRHLRFTLVTALTEAQVRADEVLALRNAVKAVPADPANPLSAVHEFPIWERYRFKAADATTAAVHAAIDRWIDSLDWTIGFSADDLGKHRMSAEGFGYKYALTIPIAERGPGRLATRFLVVNHYVGSQSTPVVHNLAPTNADFWLALP